MSIRLVSKIWVKPQRNVFFSSAKYPYLMYKLWMIQQKLQFWVISFHCLTEQEKYNRWCLTRGIIMLSNVVTLLIKVAYEESQAHISRNKHVLNFILWTKHVWKLSGQCFEMLKLTSCTARNTRRTSLATKIRNFILRQELSSQVSTLRWNWALHVVQWENANPSFKA